MSSTPPDSEFDLEKLFLPAWAQGSPSVNKYAGFAGEDRPPREHGERQGGRRPPRRDFDRQGARPKGGRAQDRPERRGGPRERSEAPAQREEPAPPPQLTLSILPDEKGIESLARQIRVSGRAYPLFDIAQLILQKPERQQIRFEVIKKPDGTPAQPLFLCALDDTLWLSEDQAAHHVLNRHFNTFYQAERTPTDPPRGTYTFVGQCGMSGTILGPPNHHDYQNQLRKLHTERFARMPFEAFKARVKIVKDEAVVKKWIEDQSFKTEFICLNVPEALKLPNREEVEKHFRQVHMGNIVKPVESHTLSGPAARQLRLPDLQRLLRMTWEEQRRFPLKVATTLSQQFAGHGLQFFKVNRTVTHVSVARPHFLDLEATPVSEGVKRIVDYINAHPKCTRRKLIETLAPAPAPAAPAAPATQGTQEPQGRQRMLPLRRRRLKRRRSRRRWRAICTGSFTRDTSLNLPTARWTRPKDRCQNRPSPGNKPRPPRFPAIHQPRPPRRPHPMEIPLRQLRLIPPRPFPRRRSRPACPPMENKRRRQRPRRRSPPARPETALEASNKLA